MSGFRWRAFKLSQERFGIVVSQLGSNVDEEQK